MESIRIEEVIVAERVRQDMGDLAGLAASINAMGLLQPIGVTPDKRLVFGERRLRACSELLGWESVPCVVIDNLTTALRLLQAEDQENRQREDLNVVEKVELARRLESILKPEAAARKAETQAKPGEKVGAQGCAVSAPPKNPDENAKKPSTSKRTREAVAEAVGMGKTTLAQATAVVDAAKENPELAPVVEEMNRTGNVAAAHRAIQPTPNYNRADDSTLARAECRDACDVIREHLPRIEGIDHAKGLERLGQLAAVIDGKKRLAKRPADIPEGVDPAQVEALLEAYPRRIDPHDARKAIGKALLIESFDVLMEAVKAFAASPAGNAGIHTKHPATWFNKRSWQSDRAEWFRGETRPQTKADDAAARMERNRRIMAGEDVL